MYWVAFKESIGERRDPGLIAIVRTWPGSDSTACLRLDAYKEFSDDDGRQEIVGEAGAAELLPERRSMSRWECEVAARRYVLEQEQADAERNYRKLMRG